MPDYDLPMEEQEPAMSPVRQFPALELLIRLYTWTAGIGAVLLVGGLTIGRFARLWAAASAMLPAGALALGAGLWFRRRGRHAIDELRKHGPLAWPSGSQDAIGQAAEFLVWATLIAQSGGRLHVFLPVVDRGIDALVHRLNDGAYLALQVKAKTALHNIEAPIAVYENHLFTPDQLVVGVHLEGD